MLETDVAKPVVEYLKNNGWEVYQEVAYDSRVIDIVAKLGNILHVVEVKTSFGLSVLAQADHWRIRKYANYVSVATPAPKTESSAYWLGLDIAKKRGIGKFDVFHKSNHVVVSLDPKINRIQKVFGGKHGWDLIDHLREEQKTLVGAGSASGGHLTDFKITARNVVAYVKENPGCTLKELMNKINSHYSSPSTLRTVIPGYVRKGIIKGIRIEEGRPLRLFPIT